MMMMMMIVPLHVTLTAANVNRKLIELKKVINGWNSNDSDGSPM